MGRGAAVTAIVTSAAAVGGAVWFRGGTVLAAVASLMSVAAFLGVIVGWLLKKLPEGRSLSRRESVAVVGGGVLAFLTVTFLPASLLDRGLPSASPSTRQPATAPAEGPTTTVDPARVRYCELAVEFLGHAQRFSGKGWQGNITKRDFDPIVLTANAALDTAPQEVRAPMTVLTSSYEAAQDGWSDGDMLANTTLALGTILSPSARAAADAVDVYENEHCF